MLTVLYADNNGDAGEANNVVAAVIILSSERDKL